MDDQVGETVGWATDKYGYVTGFTPPTVCPPEQIALHARLMAEAPAMAKILAALATLELFITARLMTGGHGPDIALIQLAAEAKVTLARVYPEGRAA